MQWDEPSARQVVLVQALETADRDGKLFSAEDRAQADRFARDGLTVGDQESVARDAAHAGRMVLRRAKTILTTLEIRHPDIAQLQHGRDWTGRAAVLVGLLAFVLGFVTDRVANPHRVDLLSLPLMGILLWNLVVYAALLVGALLPAQPANGEGLRATLTRWFERGWRWRRPAGWGKGAARAEVSARFYALWQSASATLNGQRLSRVLHVAAAACAAGIVVSLFARGLVVEYRVGWESTFLDAAQVHAILSLLFAPLVWLFSLAPFSVADVAALRFDAGESPEAGARWVYLNASLLVAVVVLPRGLLALLVWWRERRAGHQLTFDLTAPYFQEVLANLVPVRVRVGAWAEDASDRQLLRRIFLQYATDLPPITEADARLPVCTVLRSTEGDVLEWQELAHQVVSGQGTGSGVVAWAKRTLQGVQSAMVPVEGVAAQQADVVVVLAKSVEVLQSALSGLAGDGAPLVVLWRPQELQDGPGNQDEPLDKGVTACRSALRAAGATGVVLAWDAAARCWLQEPALWDAMREQLPVGKARGFGRLTKQWLAAQHLRFQQAMALLANSLCGAARMQETAQTSPLSARHVVNAGERQTYAEDKQSAMNMVMTALEQQTQQCTNALLHLYGAQAGGAGWAGQPLPDKFVVHNAVNASQAGMAGAASGAAMGVSLDLLVGGLSLGAGAALGALVGGGAAWAGAAWKNRSAPSGATVVQLSDPMLRALLEAQLLRYRSVIHQGRLAPAVAAGDVPPEWTAAVMHIVEGAADPLAPIWTAARRLGPEAADASDVTGPLATMLAELTQAVLHHLYPDTVLSTVD